MRLTVTFLIVTATVFAQQPQQQEEPLNRPGWVLRQTVGLESLGAGVFTTGIGTWRGVPEEYGRTWRGFGQRYGMRMAGIATQNVMEASIGAALHEDPRYKKAEGPFKQRLISVFRQTALVKKDDGSYGPAYARYSAIVGGNFLSNAWRADSEAKVSSALLRTAYGFLGRLAGNAYSEFGSDAMRLVKKR